MTDDDQDDVQREKTPLDYVTRDQVQDLWGAGFTIVARHQDPFHVPIDQIPRGMSYQWGTSRALKSGAWYAVPAERHPGWLAPWGYTGEVTISELTLMEMASNLAEEKHKANQAKAQQNVDDWYAKVAAGGFTENVTVLSEGKDGPKSADPVDIPPMKPVLTTLVLAKIPPDMLDHLPAIFKERDRLLNLYRRAIQSMDEDLSDVIVTPEAKAGYTREAIETVRTRLKEAPDAAQSPSHD